MAHLNRLENRVRRNRRRTLSNRYLHIYQQMQFFFLIKLLGAIAMKVTILSLILGIIFTALTFLSGATVKCFFSGCEPIYGLNYKSVPFSILGIIFLLFGLIRLIKKYPSPQRDALTISDFAKNDYEG